jgi:beta-glucanase (GH16 family)
MHGNTAVQRAGVLALGLFASAGLAQTNPTNGWQLTWSDEFEGTSLNTTKWVATDAPGNTNNELQYYSPSNVSVSLGNLILKSERRNQGGRIYCSGLVKTAGKFSQQTGRFEGRMKLPKTQGIWPAFWMLPSSNGWPPEIDIMELLGHQPNTMYMTNHWGTWPNVAVWSTPYSGPDFSAGFHTFAVEWTPTKVDFFVDGVKRASHDAGVPNEPFYMILNTAVGGNWPGYPDASTIFPQYFMVDYVRAYRQNLVNAMFEDRGSGNSQPLLGWTGFGTYSIDTVRARSSYGAWCARIAPPTAVQAVDSGLWQDFTARPGQVWNASSWWLQQSSSPLGGQTFATFDIEWYNAAGAKIGTVARPIANASSVKDSYVPASIEAQAPAGTAKGRLVLKVVPGGSTAGAVYLDDVDLQLVTANTSFEDVGPTGTVSLFGWTRNGNVFESPLNPRTGAKGGKVFGRFTGTANTSSAAQDFAVRPGEIWALNAYWYNNASDAMRGANTAGNVIEWRDSHFNVISSASDIVLDASSPTGEHIRSRVVSTVPAGAVWGRALMNFSQPGSDAGAAFFDDARLTRLLVNSSVDDLGPGGDSQLYGWIGFGNRFAETAYPRTGQRAGKIYGNFTTPGNVSGAYQEVPVTPGQRYQFTSWWINPTSDFMRGSNTASAIIEWRDTYGNLMRSDIEPALSASTPRDVYQKVELFEYAPAGAVSARLVMLFAQPGSDLGAAFFDDVSFDVAPPCVADVNGDTEVDFGDFLDFFNCYDTGDACGDIDGNPGTDFGDFLAFFNGYDQGC